MRRPHPPALGRTAAASLLYRINWHRAPPSITPGRGPPSRVGGKAAPAANPKRREGGRERREGRARGGMEGGAAVGGSRVVPAQFFFSLSPVGFLSKQGKVFHEAVAPCRLAFSSLTLGPAPVPAPAAGARARSPRCPGSAERKGPGRGAGARTWLQPPARTPRRRALLAEGPSAALGLPAAGQR